MIIIINIYNNNIDNYVWMLLLYCSGRLHSFFLHLWKITKRRAQTTKMKEVSELLHLVHVVVVVVVRLLAQFIYDINSWN